MRTALALLVLACAALPAAAAGSEEVGMSGARQYPYEGFTRIEVGFGMDLDVAQSGSYAVAVTADRDLLERVEVEKRGDTLWIGMRWGLPVIRLWRHGRARASVSLPDLEGLQANGGSRVSLNADRAARTVRVGLSGGSSVTGSLRCDAVRLEGSGGSTAELSGSCASLQAEGSGGSVFQLGQLAAREARVSLSGGSSAEVAAAERLRVTASGGSHVVYHGDPRVEAPDLSGGAWVRRD
jgi:hypothetical protein